MNRVPFGAGSHEPNSFWGWLLRTEFLLGLAPMNRVPFGAGSYEPSSFWGWLL